MTDGDVYAEILRTEGERRSRGAYPDHATLLEMRRWAFREGVPEADLLASLRRLRESGGGVITRRADRNLTSRYFIRIEDLPDGAKPLYDLSNGEMVVCYCSNDGETVTIWRPNPNSKSVYRPLAWDDAKRFLGNPVGVRV